MRCDFSDRNSRIAHGMGMNLFEFRREFCPDSQTILGKQLKGHSVGRQIAVGWGESRISGRGRGIVVEGE